MPDSATPVPAPAPSPKKIGLFQDPHFWGVLNQIGGVITFGTSHLAIVPTPIQPWVAAAGVLWAAGGTVLHLFGLANPASTQTPPTVGQ